MLMVVLPGPFYKYEVVDLQTAFSGFKFSLYAGIAALILLIIQILFKRETVSLSSTLTAELVDAAEQAANNLGWELVNVDANISIAKATDTTAWFGFKDDVLIRVTDDSNERLVDIRSKSRIGKSDLGKNAERIRSFIKELDGVLGE